MTEPITVEDYKLVSDVFDSPGGFNDSDITPSNKGWGQEVSDFREKAVASSPVEDEDDTLSYFAKLAEED